ncbi:MAG TPA: RsmE family RNA methyltransferase [Phycisphaerales bacterium]|nr:RsmE family RNA methyltransferase [Phycisphaerales bacterium]
MHRILVDGISSAAGDLVTIGGDEAHHALRVKRIREGERVELLDGRGGVASGAVAATTKRELSVRIEEVRRVPAISPRVEVWSAVPKGPRLDDMIDQLAQVGVALWRPLDTERGVVEPREAKLERIGRIAAEASKQCGRAWVMEIGGRASVAEALRAAPGVAIVMADASGSPWRPGHSAAGVVRVLIGPEGGWTESELRAAGDAGALVARFGPHVMRIETATVVAAGAVLAQAGEATARGDAGIH